MRYCDSTKSATRTWVFPGLLIFALSVLAPGLALAQTPALSNSQPILSSPKGITPNEVAAGTAKLMGHLESTQKLRLVIALTPPKLAAEKQFVHDLQTKGSPSFGKFLTPEQWNARFAPSKADEQAVVDWAMSQGFTVTGRYPNRLLVDVEAPVATIEQTFNLKMNQYLVADKQRFSNDRDPVIPGNLIGIVQNVQGLNNMRAMHPLRKGAVTPDFPMYTPGPIAGTGVAAKGNASAAKPKSLSEPEAGGLKPNITGGAYDPTDIYSSEAYDVRALYNQGHCCNPLGHAGSSPKETSIAVVTAGAQDFKDMAGFHNQYPYLAYNVVEVGIDGQAVPCNSATTSCDGEGTMDMEWSTAMSNSFGSYANTSLVVMYDAANANFGTFDDAYNRVISDNSTRVMSTSWGCEEGPSCFDDTDMKTTDGIFLNMVGTGWTLVVAAGDQGASAGCGPADAVQYPSSDPNVVAAGGATLTLNSYGEFVSETAWSGGPDGCYSNDGGGTGGLSSYWPAPGYQSSLGYSSRAVPDLALNADWYHTPQNLYFDGSLSGNGGTSIVAPELAGIFAQFNAYLLTLGNNCLNEGGPCAPMGGLVNPMIYYLAENPGYAPHYPFYDITSGCNDNDVTAFYGLGYYCAGTGYDLATGWGSFNALQLAWGIDTYRAGDFGNPYVTFSGPATSHWFNADQTVSWTVTDTSGLNGYAPNGVAGFSQAWDSDPGDVFSEPTPGSGNSFYSGPEFPNATTGYLNVSWIGQGCHRANVRAWDNSGFGSGDAVYGPICYDTVAPIISVHNSPAADSHGWNKQTVTVSLAASDPGGSNASGIYRSYYAIDTGACSPGTLGSCAVYSGPVAISAQGNHYIYYFTEDKAGNFSAETYEWVKIDETAPVATATLAGTLNGSIYDSAVKVSLSATDNLSGVQSSYYQLDGGSLTVYSAPLTVSTLGSHTVKFYSVDNAGNTEATKAVTFSIASLTVTTLTASPDPAVNGQSVTLTAHVAASLTGTPTGAVTFRHGTTTLGTGTLSGGVATFSTSTLPIGSDALTASYSGGTEFFASTSSAVTEVVHETTATTLTTSLNPAVYGQTVTFTAKVKPSASGTPTGTVKFLDGASVLGTVALSGGSATFATHALAAGANSITADYSGDSTYHASNAAALTETINKAATSTVLITSADPSSYGQSVTFTTKVTSSAGIPAGTVTFLENGSNIGTRTLSGGVASLTTSALAVGTHSMTVVYGGSANFNVSTSPAVSQATYAAHTTTTIIASVNPSSYGQSVTVTATVTPATTGTATGTVTFKNGTTTLGTATISGGKATFATSALTAGAHSITATYGGSTDYLASTSAALSHTVNRATTSSTLTSSLNPSTHGTAVTLTAKVSAATGSTPTGAVTFKDGSITLGTATLNSSGVAAFASSSLAVGTHSITAVYGGNANDLTSTSAVLSQVEK
jgi:Pro-kumamolisin, activation domain/Bacterial Ig-like domain (group 3)